MCSPRGHRHPLPGKAVDPLSTGINFADDEDEQLRRMVGATPAELQRQVDALNAELAALRMTSAQQRRPSLSRQLAAAAAVASATSVALATPGTAVATAREPRPQANDTVPARALSGQQLQHTSAPLEAPTARVPIVMETAIVEVKIPEGRWRWVEVLRLYACD